jgi:hypothetical protein
MADIKYWVTQPKQVCPISLHYEPGRCNIFPFTTASRLGMGAHTATNPRGWVDPLPGGGGGDRVKLIIQLHPMLTLHTWNVTSIPPMHLHD